MYFNATFSAIAACMVALSLALVSDANVRHESHNLDAAPVAGTTDAILQRYNRHLKRPPKHIVLRRIRGDRKACADACDQDNRCTGFEETATNICELLATGKTEREIEKKAQVDAAMRSFEAKSKIEQRAHDMQLKGKMEQQEQSLEAAREKNVGNLEIKNSELLLEIKKAQLEVNQERRNNKAKEQRKKKEAALAVAADQLGEMKAHDDGVKHHEAEKIGEEEAEAEKKILHTGTIGVAKEAMKAQIASAKRKIKAQKQKGKDMVAVAAKKAQRKDFCKDEKPESFCSEGPQPICRPKCDMDMLRSQCAKTCQACHTQDCGDKRDQQFCSEVKTGEICQDNHCTSAEFRKFCKRTCGLCGELARELIAAAEKDAADETKAVEAQADQEVKDVEEKELKIEQSVGNAESSLQAKERQDAQKLLKSEAKEMEEREEAKKYKLERMASTEKGQKILIKKGGMQVPGERNKPSFHVTQKMQRLKQREVFEKSKLNQAKGVEEAALEQQVSVSERELEANINGAPNEDASQLVHRETEVAEKAQVKQQVNTDDLADQIRHDLSIKMKTQKIRQDKFESEKAASKEQTFKDQQQLEEYKRIQEKKYARLLKQKEEQMQQAESDAEDAMANDPQAFSPKAVKDRKQRQLVAKIQNEKAKEQTEEREFASLEKPVLMMFQEDVGSQNLGQRERQVDPITRLRKLVAEERRVKAKLKYRTSRSTEASRYSRPMRYVRNQSLPRKKHIQNMVAEKRFKQAMASITALKVDLDAAAQRAIHARQKANDFVEGKIDSVDLKRQDAINTASHYVKSNEAETLIVDQIQRKLKQKVLYAQRIERQMYKTPD